MYRLFLIHPPYVMAVLSHATQVMLMSQFRAALTKSKAWTSIELPAAGLISHNCLATSASSVLVVETDSPGARPGLLPPIRPVSGIIVPIVNTPHDEHELMMEHAERW